MAKSKKQKTKKKTVEPEVTVTADPVKKKPFNPLEFFQEVRREGSKVTWTSRNEMMISTVMVIIMVIIMSGFFFVVDWVLRLLIQFILNLG